MLQLNLARVAVPLTSDSHSQFRFLYRKLPIRCRGHYIIERRQPVTTRRDKFGEIFNVAINGNQLPEHDLRLQESQSIQSIIIRCNCAFEKLHKIRCARTPFALVFPYWRNT